MSSMDVLDVGQANELKLACRRNDFTPEDLKWLCEGDNLAQVRRVRFGNASIQALEHLIDCEVAPFVPPLYKLEEHQKGKALKFHPSMVELYIDRGQQKGRRIGGELLRKRLAGKLVLNANVLDYLLKHPRLIPDRWKKEENGRRPYVYFWGTIYRDRVSRCCVRYLYWNDAGWWSWSSQWFGQDFDSYDYAAVLAG